MKLTPKQTQVILLAIQGLTNEEIAARLALSTETVKTHARAIVRVTGKRRTAWWQAVPETAITMARTEISARKVERFIGAS